MSSAANEWIVGANGLYSGTPATGFTRIGTFDFVTNAVMRSSDGYIAGVSCGVFHVDETRGRWTQLHDETVTEVLTVAPHPTGLVVGCPYGLATATTADRVLRWGFLSNALSVNHRFTSALLCVDRRDDTANPVSDYLVGTEGGMLRALGVPTASGGWEVTDPPELRWEIMSVPSVPVRAIIRAGEAYVAGTEGRGVWSSYDGVNWHPAGRGADERNVSSLAFDGVSIIGGTERGLIVGDGRGSWTSLGPSVLVTSVGADRKRVGHWLVGSNPSGLWWTESGGSRFRQVGGFSAVGAVLGPRETA